MFPLFECELVVWSLNASSVSTEQLFSVALQHEHMLLLDKKYMALSKDKYQLFFYETVHFTNTLANTYLFGGKNATLSLISISRFCSQEEDTSNTCKSKPFKKLPAMSKQINKSVCAAMEGETGCVALHYKEILCSQNFDSSSN